METVLLQYDKDRTIIRYCRYSRKDMEKQLQWKFNENKLELKYIL